MAVAMSRLSHTPSTVRWSRHKRVTFHPDRSSLRKFGPLFISAPRGLRLPKRKFCGCLQDNERTVGNKREDTGWVKTIASVALGVFLVWGGGVSNASSLMTEGGVILERQRLENIILDEISSRVLQMPDDELLRVLEDLLHSPTQKEKERAPNNRQSTSTSLPQSEALSEEDVFASLSKEPIVNSRPKISESTSQDDTRTSIQDGNEELLGALVQDPPKFENDQLNGEVGRPPTGVPEGISMLDARDGSGLEPGLTIGEIMEQIRESSLVVPDEVMYSPQEQFLMDALEGFGFEPTRMLRVVKAAGAGGIFIVTVLWGPQFIKGLLSRPADPSDIIDETLNTKPPPVESALPLGEPGQTAPGSSEPPSTLLSEKEYKEEPKENKGFWFSLSPWKWGSDTDASKEAVKERVADEGTLPKQSTMGLEEIDRLETRQPQMDNDVPTEGGVLWRRDEIESIDFQGDAQEEGGVLWRRNEAENDASIDGDVEEERFFVVEGAMDQKIEMDDQVARPAEEWTPTVWGDPWLESDSAGDEHNFVVLGRGSVDAAKASESDGEAESTTLAVTQSDSVQDDDSSKAGETDNAKDGSKQALREPAIDGKDLLSNVDDSQTTLAARIALSKRPPRQI